jgi:ABC-type sugar transport system substrate-binding protein
MADAAKAANIPLVFVNRDPAIEGVPYVGSDSLFAGTVEMEELAKLAGGKGDVVILEGQVTNEAAVSRTQGCNDVVGKNPGMKVVATQAGDWDRAKPSARNWIQSDPQGRHGRLCEQRRDGARCDQRAEGRRSPRHGLRGRRRRHPGSAHRRVP